MLTLPFGIWLVSIGGGGGGGDAMALLLSAVIAYLSLEGDEWIAMV